MSKIPENIIKHAKGGENYLKNAKMYVVNMTSHKKMLHIKNTKSCYPSKFIQNYIDFNDEQEAHEFFNKYNKTINRCDNCFSSKTRG